jgi:hypothetical protein
MGKMTAWLPEPGYTLAAGVCLGLAILAGLGTSWVNTLAWSLAAVAVLGAGSWRRHRKAKTQGGEGP